MRRKTLIYSVTGTAAAMMLGLMIFAGGEGQEVKVEQPVTASAGISRELSSFFSSSDGNIGNRLRTALEGEEESSDQESTGPVVALSNTAAWNLVADSIKSPYEDVAISRVKNYVNIRSEANTTSEVVGKIYNNSAATILETVDGEGGQWYKIKSGSVKGYMKAEYFVTGKEAEEIAKEVGEVIATTKATTLRLREEPSTSSRTLTLLAKGEEYQVKKEGFTAEDGTSFVLITLDEGDDGSTTEGYVATEYVDIRVEFKKAISIEEEKAEIERQERLKREAEEAKRKLEQQKKAAAQKAKSSKSSSGQAKSSKEVIPPDTSSSLRDAIVAYAMQFQGNPYRYGGTSLTSGTDCSGFTSSVYRDCGVSIPRDSRSQAAGGRAISVSELKLGDLVFYAKGGTISHVALYIGGGRIIHANSSRTGIIVSDINFRTPCKYATYLP